jgi:hypothetical protein
MWAGSGFKPAEGCGGRTTACLRVMLCKHIIECVCMYVCVMVFPNNCSVKF